MTTRESIDDFLRQKRIAVVGVSRNGADFTRLLFREFIKRGYDAVPVNPNASEIDGRRCYARLQDLDPPAEGVLVMTPANRAAEVARDCAQSGVSRVWFFRAAGAGAVHPGAVSFCRANGIRVVEGWCPFMFWHDAGLIHRLHGFALKLIGRHPR